MDVEVQALIEQLLYVCRRKRVMLTGFALRNDEPPFFTHFGTAREEGTALLELHMRLVEMMSDGRKVIKKNFPPLA